MAARAVAATVADVSLSRYAAYTATVTAGKELLLAARRIPPSPAKCPSALTRTRRRPPLTDRFKLGITRLGDAIAVLTAQLRHASDSTRLANGVCADTKKGLHEAQQAEAGGEESKCALRKRGKR